MKASSGRVINGKGKKKKKTRESRGLIKISAQRQKEPSSQKSFDFARSTKRMKTDGAWQSTTPWQKYNLFATILINRNLDIVALEVMSLSKLIHCQHF